MLTPSLVMVGAPHFFSRTTLRPLGPSVTLTASASVFMPRSRPRRASSLKAIVLAIRDSSPFRLTGALSRVVPATDGPPDGPWDPYRADLTTPVTLSLDSNEC